MPAPKINPAVIWQPVFVSPNGNVFLDDRAPLIWLEDMAECCKRESYSAYEIGTRIKWFECRSYGAGYATVLGPT